MQLWASLRSDRNNLARILTDLAGVKDFKGLSETSREGITALRRHMPAVIYQGSFKKGGPLWFSRQLSGNGLFWEAKIARRITSGETGPWKPMLGTDLKGILLLLSKSVREDAQNHEAVKSVFPQVEQALHVIEQDQFFNLSTLRDDLGWFWFLPGRETEGFRKGEVLIKQQEKKGDYLLSLFLDYTQLGQMEVSLSWVESVLGVRIFMEEAEKAAFVEAHLSALIKGLEDADLKVGTVICDVREQNVSEGGSTPDEKDAPTSVHVVI
jgi:hypothetical protein